MDKKILFVLHLPPPIHGSSVVGKYIMDCDLINDTFKCKYINLNTSTSINEIGRLRLYKLFKYWIIIWKVFWRITTWKPDLCYIDITAKGTAFYKDTLLITLIKLLGIKLIFHFHNKGVNTRQDKFLDNLLYRFVFHNSHVILLSEYLYYDIQKYIKEEQVHYCPNGISPLIRHAIEVKKSQKPEILFLSNLSESKGVFVLLNALKILNNKAVDFHCTFIGSSGEIIIERFNNYVKDTGLDKMVLYAGAKYGQARDIFFTMADIFAHPTCDDCFPLVILEAMKYALPVVSTFEGGIRDIVEDSVTGFLVQQCNAEVLANKLEILISDKELRLQMGAKGKKKFQNNFTITIWENKMFNILKEVINN